MKDILLSFKLSLQHCRGQPYAEVSNMMGKKSGEVTKLLVEQLRLFLATAKVTFPAWLLKILLHIVKYYVAVRWNVREICVLVKYSRKRENILGRMQENFEENFGPDIKTFSAVEKLRPTRWTVRASSFQKIIENYCLLLKFGDECVKEPLDAETRFIIIGCKRKRNHSTFSLVFALAVNITIWKIIYLKHYKRRC